MRSSRSWMVATAAILFAAVAYSVVWDHAPVESPDTSGYQEVAQDLADGSLSEFHIRTPGYPLLLWLAGATDDLPRALFRLQLVLHLAGIAVLAWILHQASLDRRLMTGFILVALTPPFVAPSAVALTESLTASCLAIMVYFLWRWSRKGGLWSLLGAGLATGYATITRPSFALLPFVLALIIPLLRWTRADGPTRSWSLVVRAGAVLVASSLALPLALAGYNAIRHDEFAMSQGLLTWSLSSKTVRYIERLPDSYALEREIMIRARDEHLVKRGSSHTGVQYWSDARPIIAERSPLSGKALDERLLNVHLEIIKRAPFEYLADCARCIAISWFPYHRPSEVGGAVAVRAGWTAFHFLLMIAFFLQLVALSGSGMVMVSRRWRRSRDAPVASWPSVPVVFPYAVAGAVVFYNLCITCLLHYGAARYRTPTDPLILFMIAAGFGIWGGLSRDEQPGRSGPA